jgi:hypothetical protein
VSKSEPFAEDTKPHSTGCELGAGGYELGRAWICCPRSSGLVGPRSSGDFIDAALSVALELEVQAQLLRQVPPNQSFDAIDRESVRDQLPKPLASAIFSFRVPAWCRGHPKRMHLLKSISRRE